LENEIEAAIRTADALRLATKPQPKLRFGVFQQRPPTAACSPRRKSGLPD
jgi:hypothetical protein